MIFEGLGNTRRQFFGSGHDKSQATKIFRRASPDVRLQEGRGGQQKRDAVLADQRTDGARIEGAGMIDDTDPNRAGQTQSSSEAEGMKERQDSQDAIVLMQHE